MNNSHIPNVSAPDDDPTGVRALLSSLPPPDPMPEHLVERINASLAAEQAHRAARSASTPVTPLLATTRRRRGRLLLTIAGAAAAAALVTVVGNSSQSSPTATSAQELSAGAPPATSRETARDSLNDARAKGAPQAAGPAAGGAGATGSAPSASAALSLVQIRESETRYTEADFVTQARNLRGDSPASPQRKAAAAAGGTLSTTAKLTDCLRAIGADRAQLVRADVAFYEGQPAVIIVATTNGTPVAYAVGRQCSRADAAVLRPATSLP